MRTAADHKPTAKHPEAGVVFPLRRRTGHHLIQPSRWRHAHVVRQRSLRAMKRKVEILVLSDLHLGTYGCRAEELINYVSSMSPCNW